MISNDYAPTTVKKYLTAIVKFAGFLQANPSAARRLRIAQVNINAAKVHARALRGSLAQAIMRSSIKNKERHEGKNNN